MTRHNHQFRKFVIAMMLTDGRITCESTVAIFVKNSDAFLPKELDWSTHSPTDFMVALRLSKGEKNDSNASQGI